MTATKVATISTDVEKGKQGQEPALDTKLDEDSSRLRSSIRKSTSCVVNLFKKGERIRLQVVRDLQSFPFLRRLRMVYIMLHIARTVSFIFLTDMELEVESEPYNYFVLAVNLYLSVSLIPILTMGTLGVLHMRYQTLCIAKILQLIACFAWFAKAVTRCVNHIPMAYFAYDLTLVFLTLWVMREHSLMLQMRRLMRESTRNRMKTIRAALRRSCKEQVHV